jgi:hypothetical protein
MHLGTARSEDVAPDRHTPALCVYYDNSSATASSTTLRRRTSRPHATPRCDGYDTIRRRLASGACSSSPSRAVYSPTGLQRDDRSRIAFTLSRYAHTNPELDQRAIRDFRQIALTTGFATQRGVTPARAAEGVGFEPPPLSASCFHPSLPGAHNAPNAPFETAENR